MEFTAEEQAKLLFESPAKWMTASKRIYGEYEVSEKKAGQCVLRDRDFTREFHTIERERNEYFLQVRKKLTSFKQILDEIQRKLTDKPTQYDKPIPDNFEFLLENFEKKISTFKFNMKHDFDLLEENEIFLEKDIERVNNMINMTLSEDPLFSSPEKLAAGGAVNHNPQFAHMNRLKDIERQQRLQEDMEHKAAVGEIDREVRIYSICPV